MFSFLKTQLISQKLKNLFKSGGASLILIEVISIFTAVTLAFMLSKWNENKNNANLEIRLLKEVYRGLRADSLDMSGNKEGHERGLDYLKQIAPAFKKDTTITLSSHDYNFIFRTFLSIQNTSGYESLKSVGLDKITNDTLLSQIVRLYEFDYQTVEKMEEQYNENHLVQLYLKPVNDILMPLATMEGNTISFQNIHKINKKDMNLLRLYLNRIAASRYFNMQTYEDVITKLTKVKEAVKTELIRKDVQIESI